MLVSATEFGLIRIFAIDLPASEILSDNGDLPTFVKPALGASSLDSAYVEIINLADLEDMGLRGYLVQGLGVAEKDLREDALQLDALKGHVLIILSRAFGGVDQTLSPRSPLRWVATYREEKAPVQFETLPAGGTKGTVAATPPPPTQTNPHLNVLWAILALPVLLLVGGLIVFLLLR